MVVLHFRYVSSYESISSFGKQKADYYYTYIEFLLALTKIFFNVLITGSWLGGFLLSCQATRWPKWMLWHWSQSTTTYPQIYWGCWLSGSADTNSYQSIAPSSGQLHAFQVKTIPASLTKNDSKVICQLIFGIKQQCHRNNLLNLLRLVATCPDLRLTSIQLLFPS